jgi:diguanylate cyclase (GGDEF)-like protein/PAS domain S-box-containing protein
MNINSYIPFDKLLDMMLDAVCIVDEQDRIVFVSSACERVFGYRPDEMAGMNIFDLVHPDDRENTFNESRKVMSGNPQMLFENRYIRKDGSTVHIMWTARWSEDHKLRIGVARDITQRKGAELLREAVYDISEAANTAEDLSSLFQQIHQIISSLMPANNFFVALYDAPSQTLSFPYFVDEKHPAPPSGKPDSSARSTEVIRTGEPLLFTAENNPASNLVHIDVGKGSLSWLGVPLKSGDKVTGVLAVQSYSGNTHYTETDLDLLQFVSTQIAAAIERKTMLTRLEYMAQYDPLTGLPNRELFIDRLRVALAHAKRNKTRVALLFIDLDKFKSINDTLGHAAGDELLQLVSGRLNHIVRASDTVARFAGDEFMVLLDGISDKDCISVCAGKIYEVFDDAFVIEQRNIQISPSIGVAVYPDDGEDMEQLLKYADQTMYDAKKQGGNMIQLKGSSGR